MLGTHLPTGSFLVSQDQLMPEVVGLLSLGVLIEPEMRVRQSFPL